MHPADVAELGGRVLSPSRATYLGHGQIPHEHDVAENADDTSLPATEEASSSEQVRVLFILYPAGE